MSSEQDKAFTELAVFKDFDNKAQLPIQLKSITKTWQPIRTGYFR